MEFNKNANGKQFFQSTKVTLFTLFRIPFKYTLKRKERLRQQEKNHLKDARKTFFFIFFHFFLFFGGNRQI